MSSPDVMFSGYYTGPIPASPFLRHPHIFSRFRHKSFLSAANLRYSLPGMTMLPLSELLGATVYDPAGAAPGPVPDVPLAPHEDHDRIASFIVQTKIGTPFLPFSSVLPIDSTL